MVTEIITKKYHGRCQEAILWCGVAEGLATARRHRNPYQQIGGHWSRSLHFYLIYKGRMQPVDGA